MASPLLAALRPPLRAAAFREHSRPPSGTGCGVRSSASIPTTDSGGSDDAARIVAWVAGHCAPTIVGGTTVDDLTAPAVAP